MLTNRYVLFIVFATAVAWGQQSNEDRLFVQFRSEQRAVVAGQETGFQALSRLLHATARDSRNGDEFIRLTQALFVHNDWIPTMPGTSEPAIPPTRLVQRPQGEYTGLPTTGWKRGYKDMTDGRVNDDDQSHHLVAYLSLGYYRGVQAGVLGSYYHKLEEGRLENAGDIRLGIVASRYGDELRHDKSRAAVLKTVDRLCSELSTRTQVPHPIHWSIPAEK